MCMITRSHSVARARAFSGHRFPGLITKLRCWFWSMWYRVTTSLRIELCSCTRASTPEEPVPAHFAEIAAGILLKQVEHVAPLGRHDRGIALCLPRAKRSRDRGYAPS